MTQVRTAGQIAYEAYIAYSDGKSLISGALLPTWYEQDQSIREAWQAAGKAVIDALHTEIL